MGQLMLSRRKLLGLGAAGASSLLLSGCDQFDFLGNRENSVRDVLETANSLTYQAQRLLVGRDALAREYSEREIRQGQRPNGLTDPHSDEYLALKAGDFVDYRLKVTGLVERPMSFSLDQLRNMPARTQITRHDCVEGWSCIAKWTGTPLSGLLDAAVVKPSARFVVSIAMTRWALAPLRHPVPFYGSCDLIDARHPQTILPYGLNDQVLPVANGAPSASALNGPWDTSSANMFPPSSWLRASLPSGGGRAAIGRTTATIGMAAFDPAEAPSSCLSFWGR